MLLDAKRVAIVLAFCLGWALLSPASAKELHLRGKLNGHADRVLAVAFSPGGHLLASAGLDGTIRLWDTSRFKGSDVLGTHQTAVNDIAFSPDGKFLVSGSRDKSVRLWELASGTAMNLDKHSFEVYSVACSRDGRTVASGSRDKTIILWNAATGQSTQILRGHTSGIDSLAFSPDGSILASASGEMIAFWDAATGRNIAALNVGGPTVPNTADGLLKLARSDVHCPQCIKFSPDGRTLASAGLEGRIILWDVATKERIGVLSGPVWTLAFSPGGGELASGGTDGKICLWDLRTGNSTTCCDGLSEAIVAVAYNPDGKMLAAACGKSIVLWEQNQDSPGAREK
jgi:WD40 repeat protein